MACSRVSHLLFLGLSLFHLNHGLDCPPIVDNIVGILDENFVHLFPKDYTVQLQVDPNDLTNSSLCIWTTLSLLKGDWLVLLQQLWPDQENFDKTNWIIRGLKQLNVSTVEGASEKGAQGLRPEAGSGRKLVALLVSLTVEALGIIQKSNCSPCGDADRWAGTDRTPSTLTSIHKPLVGAAGQKIKLDMVPPSRKQTLAQRPDCEQLLRVLGTSLKQTDPPLSLGTLAKLCRQVGVHPRQRMALVQDPSPTHKELSTV
ncbi:uncharacterized protein LOC121274982 [Carcharodon carcharias]|uniref:uncharacterized protein LOC121274982 n=1 Tax=Carcharodon carcharias TaxID=13397 RepID=UPI001B7F302E|nr:uncharacterized protein LOC121274982 [Carcharodon carcharias]XP_041038296.1 uncharacterized protein LOC121274982 [Carcharodon carcharias]XP_041038297.1 uncharacterized protein LOC121274982 [Carcharodon carcharias]XP_041038298.1 uncharacterized protein LOC121274982 [Carcharodon carcharias]XP_041038299.1 uncharacterized protein LOC121274982 [Carcharodon carcharias]XP_041038300.1 uncharacterized protein LOC121274982 [Carcharodon carcharias]XP_041038302.1 uncharacterized protein LOC121274982 [